LKEVVYLIWHSLAEKTTNMSFIKKITCLYLTKDERRGPMSESLSETVYDAPGHYLPVDGIVSRWREGSRAGFTAVPNALIHRQSKLKLSSNDIVVLLNLLSHWWFKKRSPFPRTATIAKRTGLNIRTVQRSLQHLEALGFVKPTVRSEGGVEYDLEGLVNSIADEALTHEWRNSTNEQRLSPEFFQSIGFPVGNGES